MATSYKLFLNGEWVSGNSEFKIYNPATSAEAAVVAAAGARELDVALASARRAFPSWKLLPPPKRGEYLLKAADILETKAGSASLATCREQGKPVFEAQGEFVRAIETLRWNGENAQRLCASIPMEGERAKMPEPLGIVAAFTPWNYPAVLSARKLAPSLAAGCPVILKAAEESPACAVAIVESLEEAGLPGGVVNLVFGDPRFISDHLLNSESVRVISFTGSTRVGKELARIAANNLQQCVLELGGHAPVLVFADADISKAVAEISEYKFECAGQSCNAPSRVLVERPVYQQFVREMAENINTIKVGNGESPDTTMGPMIGSRANERMKRLTDDAVSKGAKVTDFDGNIPDEGYFWPPTLLTDVTDDAQILWEEPFGPILPIIPFDDIDDAVDKANASNYGLASYLFTNSAEIKSNIISRLNVGSVSINMLCGVRADVINPGVGNSGYGYEGGDEGFRAFQNLKLINGAPLDIEIEGVL